ncbi:MAG TPA: prepilin-type N-terminal cleavage/methylation domain-containing protein [Ramlibacter sp.]|nr:prepilin-type N-terminal cleavage/methylation domain-containing protein [Ramlibacter sp.]
MGKHRMPSTGAAASRGFTLVELLVALFAMALLAILSWRGLDGMTRAQAQTEARADEVLTLQIGLAQWAADLDAVTQLPNTAALDWNGRVLRLTRRATTSAAEGLLVVGWTRREINGTGMWLRWQSPPVTTRGELQEQWLRADIWSQNPGDEEKRLEVAVTPLAQWQLFYFRENAWTNPLSSAATVPGGTATSTVTPVMPDGVRLILSLPPGQAIGGTLTRDWAQPTLGATR